jgi:hypothetical protein
MDEFETLRTLLIRFCQWDLDQWESWRIETAFGRVFISISRYPGEGADPDKGYDPLDRQAASE